MEELAEIAGAHYRSGSPEVQHLAHEFFRALDTNGDGRVDLNEFMAFMRQEDHQGHSYSPMYNPYFFRELDLDRNGTLDFEEVMTLFYIIMSGRPFCDWCRKFIPGLFFSCVECYEIPGGNFTICLDCYRSKTCDHNHRGRVQFLDTYTLLESKKKSIGGVQVQGISDRNEPWTQQSRNQIGQAASNAIVSAPPMAHHGHMNILNTGPSYSYVANPYQVIGPPSKAMAPAANNNMDKWKKALKVVHAGVQIGATSASLCTIM